MPLDVAYCIEPLVSGMMSVSVVLCEMTISSFVVTFDLHRPSRSLSFLSLDGRSVVVYWFQVCVG